MSESKQPVVDNKDDASSVTEAESKGGARDDGDDLDKLLSEYDSPSESDEGAEKAPPAKAKPETKQEPSELYDMVKRLNDRETARERDAQRRDFETDMKETVKSVRGELPATVASDRLVRAWIDGMAEDDPRLANAWVNRKKDPKAFGRVIESLSREFAKEFSKRPDPDATDDRHLVSAAVKGASSKAPEDKPANYSGMSDADFAAETEKKFGFRPF